MTVLVLDPLLRPIELIDDYYSFIWKERFQDAGDFELVVRLTSENRQRFAKGVWLGHPDSYRVMEVETAESSRDDDGRKILTVTGYSLEALMKQRVARDIWSDTTAHPNWVITETPGNIARTIFWQACVFDPLDPKDAIPYMTEGSFFPADTLAESGVEITLSIPVGTVFDRIQEICKNYELGFRLVRGDSQEQLFFNIYAGNDRSSSQTMLESVIFAEELDNLADVNELNSKANHKNVAYVFSPIGSTMIYESEDAVNVSGFNRRIILVNATDVTDDYLTENDLTLEEALLAKGNAALAEHRKTLLFDGQVAQLGRYQEGVNYFLGDVVEMRDLDRVTKLVRVSEVIRVSDGEGKRTYPTLTDLLYLQAGTWAARTDPTDVWETAEGTWAEASPDIDEPPIYAIGTWSEETTDEWGTETTEEWIDASDDI